MSRSNALKPPPPYDIARVPVEPETDKLGRYVGISVGLHLAVLAMLTLRAVFYPSEPLVLERAIRVDMVGLPDKQAKLPPAPKPKEAKPESGPQPKTEVKPEAAKPEPSRPDKVALPDRPKAEPDNAKINLDKTKAKQDSALKRLAALRKLEEEAAANKAKQTASKPTLVKGNEISPGSALNGIAKLENDSYLTSIDGHVKQYWDVPNFLANASLSASIVIYLDESGNVVKKRMVKSSGNQIFDQTVINAVEKASPFPTPPKKLVNIFMVDGIHLGFPE